MIFIDLIQNLALLVALSLIAGFVADRTRDRPRLGVLLLGLVFGSAAVLGMLRPLTLGPGLIFDGRSVMLSLCGLFFGPAATALACAISVWFRLIQGGVGAFTGALVMLASGGVGLLFHRYCRPWERDTSASTLLLLGLITHVAML
ncbi:MAG: LytS/YhcK type 5TM receptor domain-containing protein, partial [Desulfovibrionaceae bacterium]